eukprot:1162125-Pelagomonas_calceolata.AAC.3
MLACSTFCAQAISLGDRLLLTGGIIDDASRWAALTRLLLKACQRWFRAWTIFPQGAPAGKWGITLKLESRQVLSSQSHCLPTD